MTASISVVLAARDDTPELHRNIESLTRQCAAVGGELLVADGSAQGLPVAGAVRLPGADVFTLRCAAIAAARGDVVAITEDHCLVAGDWCAAHLDAHRRHPAALAIGGLVANGSVGAPIDRANFLVTFAPFMAPAPAFQPRRCGPVVNLSFVREALPLADLVPGFVELAWLPHLHRTGRLRLDPAIVATHVQSHGNFGTLMVHHHNGRSSAGLGPARPLRLAALARVARAPRRVAELLRETFAETRRRGQHIGPGATLGVVAIVLAHVSGDIAGCLLGPGKSPQRLA